MVFLLAGVAHHLNLFSIRGTRARLQSRIVYTTMESIDTVFDQVFGMYVFSGA